MKEFGIGLKFLFVLLLVIIGAVLVRELAPIIADIGQHIMRLFGIANLNPNSYGFGATIQLILIAVFVGWSINRLKRWNNRR